MAKARKKRKNYTVQQRESILTAAQRDRLTAAQVQRKFGVTPVTYYSWRKKSGVARARGGAATLRVAAAAGHGGNLSSQLRNEVAQRVRQILPEIVRTEVNSYLNTLFASGPGRRRGQRT
jgi:transposase-like protein